MSKKLYYTCPIEAAYMTRYFEVKFISAYDEYLVCGISDGSAIWYLKGGDVPIPYIQDEFFIHPDSLFIFEPREDDIIINQGYICQAHGDYEYNDLVVVRSLSVVRHANPFDTQNRIIQRNNRPFLMPKTEQ